jgi:hypothetical protein
MGCAKDGPSCQQEATMVDEQWDLQWEGNSIRVERYLPFFSNVFNTVIRGGTFGLVNLTQLTGTLYFNDEKIDIKSVPEKTSFILRGTSVAKDGLRVLVEAKVSYMDTRKYEVEINVSRLEGK